MGCVASGSSPNQQRRHAKWELGQNMHALHALLCTFGADFACSVGAYQQSFCVGAQSANLLRVRCWLGSSRASEHHEEDSFQSGAQSHPLESTNLVPTPAGCYTRWKKVRVNLAGVEQKRMMRWEERWSGKKNQCVKWWRCFSPTLLGT